MKEPSTIKQLIDRWPARRHLADDLGISVDRVHKWAQSNSIPAQYHLPVVRSAGRREIAANSDLLDRLHYQKPQKAGGCQ